MGGAGGAEMMEFWLIPAVMMLVIVGLFPPIAGYIVLVERKVLADMQVRLGPMHLPALMYQLRHPHHPSMRQALPIKRGKPLLLC